MTVNLVSLLCYCGTNKSFLPKLLVHERVLHCYLFSVCIKQSLFTYYESLSRCLTEYGPKDSLDS